MGMEEDLKNGITSKKLLDLAVLQKSLITMRDILWFLVWIQMIKIQLLITWEYTMLKLEKKKNGGSMETGVDLKNGITFKNLKDSVKMLMISIDKQAIHTSQV